MRKMKKFLTLAMTATLLFSSMTVNAAEVSMTAKQNADYMMSANKDGAPNWFNGAYYSDRYEDLKIAFNTNEKALYNQSLQYGFNEARLVTPVLDVVKYRDFYPDLDEAFGDNWKLYVRHYFEYGIYEGRENFTDFDAKTYLSMYTDLQNAFGTDLGLATRHYIEFGISEGREYSWPEPEIIYAETDNNNDDDNASSDNSSSDNDNTDENFTGEKRVEDEDGFYTIKTYVNGVCISEKYYTDGIMESSVTYTYNDEKLKVEELREDFLSDHIIRWVYEYDSKGREIKCTEYYAEQDGQESLVSTLYKEYDGDSNRLLRLVKKNNDGETVYYEEHTYHPNGEKYTVQGKYPESGEESYYEYDENGNQVVYR